MSFPRYPEYKDSGVEWLGKVPGHWEVLAIKWLSPVLRGASPRPIDDPKYFDDYGEYAWVRIADVSASDGVLKETPQRLSALGSSLSVKIAPGDLFVSIAGTVGKPCISHIKACIHDGFVYFPRLKISPKLFYRIFESGLCYGGLGKWGTQLNLNTDTIGSIRVVLPPQKELNQVLAFLDREIAKIDALIAEQQRLIELLKEKRQAVVSHTVTKGLSTGAPMKDSGIEWLGEVPAHWEVKSLRHIAKIVRGASPRPAGDPKYFSSENLDGINTAWVTVAEITKDTEIYLTEVSEYLTPSGATNSQYFESGTLIFSNSGATLGVPKILGIDCCANDGVLAFKELSSEVDILFAYLFLSTTTERLRTEMKQGGGQPNLNTAIVKNIGIAVPPIEEQFDISSFLSNELIKLDALTAEAQRGIALLKERRSALISAAVTGKIDVRGLS